MKSYLDNRGIFDSRFKKNLPGIDWLNLFVKRHNLTQRLSDNVSSGRAEITSDIISDEHSGGTSAATFSVAVAPLLFSSPAKSGSASALFF